MSHDQPSTGISTPVLASYVGYVIYLPAMQLSIYQMLPGALCIYMPNMVSVTRHYSQVNAPPLQTSPTSLKLV